MPYGTLIRWGFGLLLIGLTCAGLVKCGYERGTAAGEAKVRDNELRLTRIALDAANAARRLRDQQAKRYETRAEAMSATAAQYLEALNDANRKHDRTVADLRAGNLRLQRQWRGCAVLAAGEAAASAGAPDDAADDRAASAGRIVRAAAACDAQVVGLQKILAEERK